MYIYDKGAGIMAEFIYKNKKIYYDEIGIGEVLILLHGNTASSRMFMPIIPLLSDSFTVVTMDFLGCGQSERLDVWPIDLWYQWSMQVVALCKYKGWNKVNIIGCSGGALAALNVALEFPDLVNAVILDSFMGIEADISLIEKISFERECAKNDMGFQTYLCEVHGKDWKSVLDADTCTIIKHAKTIGKYLHHSLSELKVNVLLTGSLEDEMFPCGHYEELFKKICVQTNYASSQLFQHGNHPAMMSNQKEFVCLAKTFLLKFNISYGRKI